MGARDEREPGRPAGEPTGRPQAAPPDADPFAAAAPFYARYRPPYPAALLDLIAMRAGLDRAGRALDLGTGTGQVAIPLAARCAEVVAADVSAAMLDEARRGGAAAGATNIRWLRSAAEELPPDLGPFRLVTIAQAFHWMDGPAVLRRLWPQIAPGGLIALLGMATIWGAPEPFAVATVRVIRRWLGEERRVGTGLHRGTRASGHRPFEETLADGGFVAIERGEIAQDHVWDLDSLIGCLYSTSYCSPAHFGDRLAAFEADLRRELLALDPAGRFVQALDTNYTLARRP